METLKQIYCFLIINECCTVYFNNKKIELIVSDGICHLGSSVYRYVDKKEYPLLRIFDDNYLDIIKLITKCNNVSYCNCNYPFSSKIYKDQAKTIFVSSNFVNELKQYIDGKS